MKAEKNAVIIGAGCTGRGFIAKILNNSGYHITFLDKNKELIKKMRQKKSYMIFYGGKYQEVNIKNFEIFDIHDEMGTVKLLEADIIFAAVRTSNLSELAPILHKAYLIKKEKCTDPVMKVILCENGLNFHKILRKALDEIGKNEILVTEAAVFCTTIEKQKESLDILSEEYFTLQYDTETGGFTVDIPGIKGINNMEQLLERKIFTYNCLSACIAYTGYYKGYTGYAQAANDNEINDLCKKIRNELSPVLSIQFNVSEKEQNEFSESAMKKFCNYMIADTIEKNARDVKRKLGEKERILGPLELLKEKGGNINYLCLIAAAAVYYGEKEEDLSVEEIFLPEDIFEKVMYYLELLKDEVRFRDIIKRLEE